jgi:four helix bundle protein
MPVKHYRELIVWQKSVDLVEAIYRISQRFPSDERFGLTSQLRRAAISIPSNVAEGQSRGTPRDFNKFLDIANGSLAELETQLIIAARLTYLTNEERDVALSKSAEIGRLLNGLQKSIAAKD